MDDKVSILGFSGSGKTSYILSLYNYYNKVLRDENHFINVEDRRTKSYMDKLLRNMKFNKKTNSTKENREIHFTLKSKRTYESVLSFNMPDYKGEILWQESELIGDTIQLSNVLIFLLDGSKVLNNPSEFEEEISQIISLLKTYLSPQTSLLFMISKYDIVLDQKEEIDFGDFKKEHLSSLTKGLYSNHISKYDIMNLSSYTEIYDEILFDESINLIESFEWILSKTRHKEDNEDNMFDEIGKNIKKNLFGFFHDTKNNGEVL
jgi:GTPase SAR1 family protein